MNAQQFIHKLCKSGFSDNGFKMKLLSDWPVCGAYKSESILSRKDGYLRVGSIMKV